MSQEGYAIGKREAEPRTPNIRELVEEMDKQVAHLADRIDLLEVRLEPVLLPTGAEKNPTSSQGGQVPHDCLIGNALRHTMIRLAGVSSRLQTTIERINV